MIISSEYTNQGGRDKNEDTCMVTSSQYGMCAVVADGLGGHGGGEIASELAAKKICDGYQKLETIDAEEITRLIKEAEQAVCEAQTSILKMKTTVVTLFLDEEQAIWAHVGDSRLYHFVNGTLIEQTMDQSVSQMAVLAGEITPDQIRFHEDRNKLLRALGMDGEARAEIAAPHAIGNDQHAFLLCTDGFWEYVLEAEMVEDLQHSQTPEEWIQHMLSRLQERVTDHNDNYTAVAVFCSKDQCVERGEA